MERGVASNNTTVLPGNFSQRQNLKEDSGHQKINDIETSQFLVDQKIMVRKKKF